MRGILATLLTVFVYYVAAVRGYSGHSSIQRKNGWSDSAQHPLEIHMPGVTPRKEDMYLCTSVKLADYEQYVVQYEAMASGNTAHHMLLFGCDAPYSNEAFWLCGGTCKGSSKIMFAWAKNAPPTRLPKDVGFHIGGNSGVKHLVLQIHYKDAFPADASPDKSGLRMQITRQKQKFIAGIYLMMAYNLQIKPHSLKTHADVSCRYRGKTDLYPFAYRVHAHLLGEVITGYQYNDSWHLLGKGNPQWPQAFYPMEKTFRIKPGDYMFTRCTYNAKDSSKTTYIGSTHHDEMCNFYMMYYTDSSRGSAYGDCGGNNYPDLMKKLPAGSDTPLPPNPLLEETAKGKATSGLGKIAATGGSLYEPSSQYFAEPASDNNNNNYDYNYGLDYGGGGVGGGSVNPEADRDYFYYEVQNQRSRNRHPFRKSQQGYYSPGQQLKGYSQNRQTSNGYRGRGQQYDSWRDRQSFAGRQWQPQQQQQPSLKQPQQLYSNNKKSYNRLASYKSNTATNTNQKPVTSLTDRTSSETHHKSEQMVEHTHRVSGHKPQHTAQKKPFSKVPASAGTRNKVDTYQTLHKTEPDQTSSLSSSSLEVTENWPQDSITLGQISGVSTDTNSNVHIFHRGSRRWDGNSFDVKNKFNQIKDGPIKEKTLVTFSREGKIINQWGDNMFYLPHGLTIDGSGNTWVTDVGMHQVFKFKNGSTTPEFTLGEKFVPGNDKSHFCKPAAVAVLTSGEFYVADGYCNHRVVKFSKDGKYLMEWGTRTTSTGSDGFPPPAAFDIPHSISVAEDKQRLYVADRENSRIQVFDLTGKFITQFHPVQFGRMFAVTYNTKNGFLYAVNGPGVGGKKVQGFTLHPVTGKVLEMWSPHNKGFSNPHDVAVSTDGKCIFVGEIGPNKLWRFHVKLPDLPITQLTLHHPETVDKETQKKNTMTDDAAEFTASLVIGGLLIVPVVIVIVIALFFRLRKSGGNKKKSYAYTILQQKQDLEDQES